MTAGAEAPVSGDCNAGLKGQLYRAGRVQRTAPGALTESKARFFYGWDVPAEPGTHSKTYLNPTKYNAREHALPNPRSSGAHDVSQKIPDLHCFRVHYIRMKNVTLSAEEHWIEQARLVARSQRTTLNAAFRAWLEQYASGAGSAKEVDALMKRLRHVKAGQAFTRDEMNAR